MVVESPDVGGNQAGLQRSLSARGTPNAQNTQLLNGVNVNDPAAQGFAMNYYVPRRSRTSRCRRGAQDISVGTGGVVHQHGHQERHATASRAWRCRPIRASGTQATNIDDALDAGGLPAGRELDRDYITNTNVQAGGPLLRNKLFFFGSFNYQATHVNVPSFPPFVPSYSRRRSTARATRTRPTSSPVTGR